MQSLHFLLRSTRACLGVKDVTSAIISHRQTQSNGICCFQMLAKIIKVADKVLCYILAGNRVYCRPSLFNSFQAKLVKYVLQKIQNDQQKYNNI